MLQGLWTFVLAFQEAGNGAAPAAPAGDPAPTGLGPMLVMFAPMLIIIVVFQFMIGGQQRREQRRKDAMLKAIKKNDRVVTIGGIIGTVVNVTTDGKEVTLRVDSNTRIEFQSSAIREVLTRDEMQKDDK